MNFLSGMLRDEGGLDYKAAIADTIITIIEDNPDAKDTGKRSFTVSMKLKAIEGNL